MKITRFLTAVVSVFVLLVSSNITLIESVDEVSKVNGISIDDDDDEDLRHSQSIHRMFNFASHQAGAVIIDKSSSAKGFQNLLNDDKDKYGISPCQDKKWVVIGLSEDILITSVILANYEKYSSTVKEFQLLGSISYPSTEWIDLGTYLAEPKLGEQQFNITHQPYGHTRYLRIRFLTHYSDEALCTLSQIKVFGITVIASLKQEVEMSQHNLKDMLIDLQKEVDEILEGDSSTNTEEISNFTTPKDEVAAALADVLEDDEKANKFDIEAAPPNSSEKAAPASSTDGNDDYSLTNIGETDQVSRDSGANIVSSMDINNENNSGTDDGNNISTVAKYNEENILNDFIFDNTLAGEVSIVLASEPTDKVVEQSVNNDQKSLSNNEVIESNLSTEEDFEQLEVLIESLGHKDADVGETKALSEEHLSIFDENGNVETIVFNTTEWSIIDQALRDSNLSRDFLSKTFRKVKELFVDPISKQFHVLQIAKFIYGHKEVEIEKDHIPTSGELRGETETTEDQIQPEIANNSAGISETVGESGDKNKSNQALDYSIQVETVEESISIGQISSPESETLVLDSNVLTPLGDVRLNALDETDNSKSAVNGEPASVVEELNTSSTTVSSDKPLIEDASIHNEVPSSISGDKFNSSKELNTTAEPDSDNTDINVNQTATLSVDNDMQEYDTTHDLSPSEDRNDSIEASIHNATQKFKQSGLSSLNATHNCFESLQFLEFQSKLMAKIQQKSGNLDESMQTFSKDNVFRHLVQRIRSLETNQAIVEIYLVQLSECLRKYESDAINARLVSAIKDRSDDTEVSGADVDKIGLIQLIWLILLRLIKIVENMSPLQLPISSKQFLHNYANQLTYWVRDHLVESVVALLGVLLVASVLFVVSISALVVVVILTRYKRK